MEKTLNYWYLHNKICVSSIFLLNRLVLHNLHGLINTSQYSTKSKNPFDLRQKADLFSISASYYYTVGREDSKILLLESKCGHFYWG